MNLRPNPASCPQILSVQSVESHRKIDCRYYDRCLDVAIEKKWESFCCNACFAHDPIPLPPLSMERLESIIEAGPAGMNT